MDCSSESSLSQQDVTIPSSSVAQIAQLCDYMQMLRAWWERFEAPLRQVDKVAALKAHDLMVEGVITARQLARQLGFALPDVSDLDWTPSPRPGPGYSEL